MKVLLALPAYNEERALPSLLDRFRLEMGRAGYASQVIVVDDGSTDGTRRVVASWSRELPVELILHPVNQGLGAALRDGLRRAVELAAPDDVIVTMDADNTHPPELIPAMVHAIAAGSDVVIASRYRRGSRVAGLSAVRHVMSFGARVLFTLAFPIRGVRDYTSAFRAYRPQVLERAFAEDGKLVTESGFASMPELLLRLRKANARCRELPMVLLYDHKCSASKMDVAGTAWKTLCMIARLRIAGNGPRWR